MKLCREWWTTVGSEWKQACASRTRERLESCSSIQLSRKPSRRMDGFWKAPCLIFLYSSDAMNVYLLQNMHVRGQKARLSWLAWIVVRVYDCTPFLKDHSGGTHSILNIAVTDWTKELDAMHSDTTKKGSRGLSNWRILWAPATSPNNSIQGPSNLHWEPLHSSLERKSNASLSSRIPSHVSLFSIRIVV